MKIIIKFLWKNVICQHECFDVLITDKDSENKNVLKVLMKKYEIKHIHMFSYNSQANEWIKIDHRLIINALSKLTMREKIEDKKNWVSHMFTVF